MNIHDRLLQIQTSVDCKQLEQILARAAEAGRNSLFEHEAYAFLSALGSETVPRCTLLLAGGKPGDEQLQQYPGASVVMKIVSPTIVHKTEVGGVRVVANDPDTIRSTWRRMLYEVPERYKRLMESREVPVPVSYKGLHGDALLEAIATDIQGVLLIEFMPPDSEAFGNELIVGLRNTREFGMMLSAGLGGTDTELYATFFRKNKAIVTAATHSMSGLEFFKLFRQTVSYQKLIGLTRGQKRIVTDEQLVECFSAMIEVGNHFSSSNADALFHVSEFEVNPFAFTDFRMVPLDGLLNFNVPEQVVPERPVENINNLLHPKSIGIIGVSSRRVNFGKVILRNILQAGFDPQQLLIIQPDEQSIDNIRCIPDLAALETPLDLLVVAIGSEHVPDLIDRVIETNCAKSVLLIPGGLGETEESKQRAEKLRLAIHASRKTASKGPTILGANSMGVISHPGSYDTWFLPEDKLAKQKAGGRQRIAFISQSGAFMGTRMSRFPDLNPQYLVSIGNQTDLTLGDFMEYFSRADNIDVIGVYAEGFNDLDGDVFSRAVREAAKAGKDVVFYKAGRTPEGQLATSGHTASLAGDYVVCEACLRQAGAVVAQTIDQFADLLNLAAQLNGVRVPGKRIAGFSSAGFEAVGLADYIHTDDYSMELAAFSEETVTTLSALMKDNRLDKLVTVQNPLDINPGADDRVFAEVVRILAEDDAVDGVIAGLIPITPAMHSLSDGSDAYREGIYHHISSLKEGLQKPLVLVVDGGIVFNPFVEDLEALGYPVFRSIDRAVMALALYVEARLDRKKLL